MLIISGESFEQINIKLYGFIFASKQLSNWADSAIPTNLKLFYPDVTETGKTW